MEQPARPVRILHTSDLHLGDPLRADRRSRHSPECLCPLSATLAALVDAKADLLIVAGDLFDSNRVAAPVVAAARNALASAPTPVVIVPGNHDPLDQGSVYKLHDWSNDGQLNLVSNPGGELLAFPELRLWVWARPVIDHRPESRPLAGAPQRPTDGWYVVVAHGHYEDPLSSGAPPRRSSPITDEELAAVDADYVALGHWNEAAQVGPGAANAWYSGSPNRPSTTASVNLVTLAAGSVPLVETRQIQFPETCMLLGVSGDRPSARH